MRSLTSTFSALALVLAACGNDTNTTTSATDGTGGSTSAGTGSTGSTTATTNTPTTSATDSGGATEGGSTTAGTTGGGTTGTTGGGTSTTATTGGVDTTGGGTSSSGGKGVKKGWAALDKGDYDKARQICMEATFDNPGNAEAHYCVAQAARGQGDMPTARERYCKAKSLASDPELLAEITAIIKNIGYSCP